eukprot:TRINITY_DN25604_c0_g2_i2.p1 TRINITY_DN25604_c0_g2~~TRINITY_DN25604_c0_g2_i2.p1  ORF type:complete len:160 (+),score=37.27 TRINITY_DN25604_c0_g2_i2:353-832(+)
MRDRHEAPRQLQAADASSASGVSSTTARGSGGSLTRSSSAASTLPAQDGAVSDRLDIRVAVPLPLPLRQAGQATLQPGSMSATPKSLSWGCSKADYHGLTDVELKSELLRRGYDSIFCFTREDLIQRLLETKGAQPAAPRADAEQSLPAYKAFTARSDP